MSVEEARYEKNIISMFEYEYWWISKKFSKFIELF